MLKRWSIVASSSLLALVASGCGIGSGPDFVASYEPWRSEEERACLRSGFVAESPFLHMRASLGGGSGLDTTRYCGAEHPFEMSGVDGGRISLKPAALLRCEMIPQVERWVKEIVEPASLSILRSPVVEVKVAASYSCRPIDSIAGGKLSEHGHANAIDISGFVLADGRTVLVKSGWHGSRDEVAFLHSVHDGACRNFTTVLSPDYDGYHQDHLHLDLAKRGRDGLARVCK